MTTPALRVNGLMIVNHATANENGYGPYSGIQIAIQKEAPPHSGNGGVLWSDGEALHWSTASGRDVELPSVISSHLLVVHDLDHALSTQAEGSVIAGVVGGGEVLAVLLLVRFGYWLLRKAEVSAWLARQTAHGDGPYRDGKKENRDP